MTKGSGQAFFERAVTIHRYDCEAVATSAATPAGAEGDGYEPSATEPEAVIRYTLAARPLYDGMRRLIGHVAGLLVLVQAGGRRDVLDLPDLAVARDRWLELRDALRDLASPRGLEQHSGRLELAHATIGEALDEFDAARCQSGWKRRLDDAGEKIKSAYATLQTASEPRAGMTMVDFSQACCSCAQHWRQKGGSNGPVFDLGA